MLRPYFSQSRSVVPGAIVERMMISGQVIGTSGWQASRYSQRHVIRSISRPTRWSVDELSEVVPNQLVAGVTNPAPARQPEEQPQPAQ